MGYVELQDDMMTIMRVYTKMCGKYMKAGSMEYEVIG